MYARRPTRISCPVHPDAHARGQCSLGSSRATVANVSLGSSYATVQLYKCTWNLWRWGSWNIPVHPGGHGTWDEPQPTQAHGHVSPAWCLAGLATSGGTPPARVFVSTTFETCLCQFPLPGTINASLAPDDFTRLVSAKVLCFSSLLNHKSNDSTSSLPIAAVSSCRIASPPTTNPHPPIDPSASRIHLPHLSSLLWRVQGDGGSLGANPSVQQEPYSHSFIPLFTFASVGGCWILTSSSTRSTGIVGP